MQYRVVNTATQDETTVLAHSPEHAAETALGRHVVRSGSRRDLLAKVYWQKAGDPMSMVRLYSLVEARAG